MPLSCKKKLACTHVYDTTDCSMTGMFAAVAWINVTIAVHKYCSKSFLVQAVLHRVVALRKFDSTTQWMHTIIVSGDFNDVTEYQRHVLPKISTGYAFCGGNSTFDK